MLFVRTPLQKIGHPTSKGGTEKGRGESAGGETLKTRQTVCRRSSSRTPHRKFSLKPVEGKNVQVRMSWKPLILWIALSAVCVRVYGQELINVPGDYINSGAVIEEVSYFIARNRKPRLRHRKIRESCHLVCNVVQSFL